MDMWIIRSHTGRLELEREQTIVREEMLWERYGQHIFVSACFAPTNKALFSVLMLMGEKLRAAVV